MERMTEGRTAMEIRAVVTVASVIGEALCSTDGYLDELIYNHRDESTFPISISLYHVTGV
jgi:hypothetical protein